MFLLPETRLDHPGRFNHQIGLRPDARRPAEDAFGANYSVCGSACSGAGPEALWRWPLRCRLLRLAERRDEIGERLFAHVGRGDISEVRVGPPRDVIAVNRLGSVARSRALGAGRQLGHGDEVLVMPVDEGRRGNSVDDRDAAAGERESDLRKVDDVRTNRGAAGEPGL
jgi:hypothetical protein